MNYEIALKFIVKNCDELDIIGLKEAIATRLEDILKVKHIDVTESEETTNE